MKYSASTINLLSKFQKYNQLYHEYMDASKQEMIETAKFTKLQLLAWVPMCEKQKVVDQLKQAVDRVIRATVELRTIGEELTTHFTSYFEKEYPVRGAGSLRDEVARLIELSDEGFMEPM